MYINNKTCSKPEIYSWYQSPRPLWISGLLILLLIHVMPAFIHTDLVQICFFLYILKFVLSRLLKLSTIWYQNVGRIIISVVHGFLSTINVGLHNYIRLLNVMLKLLWWSSVTQVLLLLLLMMEYWCQI